MAMNRREFAQLMLAAIGASTALAHGVTGDYFGSSVSGAKAPDCSNHTHPPELSRLMLLLANVGHAKVYGCQPCWDVNHEQSVRVLTDPEYMRYVRDRLIRQGKMPSQKPVVMFCKWKRSNKPHGLFDGEVPGAPVWTETETETEMS